MNLEVLKKQFITNEKDALLMDVYLDEALLPYLRERFAGAIDSFIKAYKVTDGDIYSAPGRTEVGGNHTDHQHGRVLAASINRDAITVVSKADSINVISEAGGGMITIDINDLEKKDGEEGTTASLIRGVAAGLKNRGYKNYAYVGSDGAAAIDAENLMLYEGQKIDPEFKCLASYRYAQTDTVFSTIVTTVMAMDPTPQMTLQQGGGNVVSFIQQASMYDFYGNSTIWSDVVIAAGLVQALVGAGVYSYEGSFGAGVFAWWDEKFQDFYDDYKKVSIAGYGTEDPPADFSLYTYWSGVAIVSALEDCIASGKDYKDGTVLTEALEKVSFESCGTEHHFRDIDHQLTMDIYFIEATDAGEEYHHYAKPKDPNAVYSADEYLPSKEEMKEYGEKVLGVKGRFD